MHIVINALPTTNLSGAYVLHGYLRALVQAALPTVRFTILTHARNPHLIRDYTPHVHWYVCQGPLHNWIFRSAWDQHDLPRLLQTLQADALLMCSGTVLTDCPVPQAALAMNPWCLVPGLRRRLPGHLKAALQRSAYRVAVRRADLMIYLSAYLRDAYAANAGCAPRAAVVAYPPLAEDVLEPAPELFQPRERHHIVCVSAMAAHKGVETLIAALARLRNADRVPATLTLAGAWPDPAYARRIARLIEEQGLSAAVELTGHLERSELLRTTAQARVFCLLSQCESFGIPGAEAQALGTPVVAARSGALPEVYGDGGVYVPAGDAEAAADALREILTDDARWQTLSRAATANARRFTPSETGRQLAALLNLQRADRPAAR